MAFFFRIKYVRKCFIFPFIVTFVLVKITMSKTSYQANVKRQLVTPLDQN